MEDYKTKKERDRSFGMFGEQIAAEYYIKNGYAIRERNWRLGKIEIDIIAQRGNIIVFSEVKARRGNYEDAVYAVKLDKMKRMARGANAYLQGLDGYFEYRFDIFALSGDFKNYKVEVIEDAFLSPLIN